MKAKIVIKARKHKGETKADKLKMIGKPEFLLSLLTAAIAVVCKGNDIPFDLVFEALKSIEEGK